MEAQLAEGALGRTPRGRDLAPSSPIVWLFGFARDERVKRRAGFGRRVGVGLDDRRSPNANQEGP